MRRFIVLVFLAIALCQEIETEAPVCMLDKTLDVPSVDSIETLEVSGNAAFSLAEFREKLLQLHNEKRRLHHVPPLTLSNKLNDIAQKYANKLSSMRALVHSRNGYGENLYWRTSTPPTDIDASFPLNSWYNEVSEYDFEKGGFSSKTGHFTQVVWKGSQQLGVGYVRKGGDVYVVANYYPPGNHLGQFKQNVFKE